MNILMYFNGNKTTFLVAELKAELQRTTTIATTTQYDVQRIAMNRNELERIGTNPKHLTAHVLRSL